MGDYKQQTNKRSVGARYEREAGAYLEKLGCQIIEYNYRCKLGEIDLVAKDGVYLVFCEVKYRSGAKKGHPMEAVDYRKQRIISKCAMHYLMEHGLTEVPCRFDVVGIAGSEIIHLKDAFDYIQ